MDIRELNEGGEQTDYSSLHNSHKEKPEEEREGDSITKKIFRFLYNFLCLVIIATISVLIFVLLLLGCSIVFTPDLIPMIDEYAGISYLLIVIVVTTIFSVLIGIILKEIFLIYAQKPQDLGAGGGAIEEKVKEELEKEEECIEKEEKPTSGKIMRVLNKLTDLFEPWAKKEDKDISPLKYKREQAYGGEIKIEEIKEKVKKDIGKEEREDISLQKHKKEQEEIHGVSTFPYDLRIVILWVILTNAFVLIPHLNEIFLRIIFAWTMVLFLPGYVLIAFLFPEKRDLGLIERIALSFGLSAAITPLLGLILNFTPFGIRLVPIVIILSSFIFLFSILAYLKLRKIPKQKRFNENFNPSNIWSRGVFTLRPGYKQYLNDDKIDNKVETAFKDCGHTLSRNAKISKIDPYTWTITDGMITYRIKDLITQINIYYSSALRNLIRFPEKGLDKALFVIMILSVAFCIFTLIFVITVPKQGEKFTEFYILNENGTANWYPTNLSVGEQGIVNINVVSHEHERVEYELLIEWEDNETLHTEQISLDHNETWNNDFTFIAEEQGIKKLTFLLYKDNETYRKLHLWVQVNEIQIYENINYSKA